MRNYIRATKAFYLWFFLTVRINTIESEDVGLFEHFDYM